MNSLFIEILGIHIEILIVAKNIDEGVTSICPKEGIDNAANLRVTRLRFNLNDRCNTIHGTLRPMPIIVIGSPHSIWLPLDRIF